MCGLDGRYCVRYGSKTGDSRIGPMKGIKQTNKLKKKCRLGNIKEFIKLYCMREKYVVMMVTKKIMLASE